MKKQWLWVAGAVVVAGSLVAMVARPAPGVKVCEDLKSEIGSRLDAKGVKKYSLDIVANADVGGRKVVGSCDAGSKKVVYSRK
jgi:hypothetical protein